MEASQEGFLSSVCCSQVSKPCKLCSRTQHPMVPQPTASCFAPSSALTLQRSRKAPCAMPFYPGNGKAFSFSHFPPKTHSISPDPMTPHPAETTADHLHYLFALPFPPAFPDWLKVTLLLLSSLSALIAVQLFPARLEKKS